MKKIANLSFLRAHGTSANMIRYNDMYYGYYAYFYLSRTGKIGNGVPPITKEQVIEEIKIHQVATDKMVANCFQGMTTKKIQKLCMDRFEKLNSTDYTTNTDYGFTDALKFCHEHKLHNELKYIVQNYPDREEVKKYLSNRFFVFWTPISDYIREGNLNMVKFFYEQGADFSDNDFYLIKLLATENQMAILKYLFPKYKKRMSDDMVHNYGFSKNLEENKCFEALEYLAKNGFYSYTCRDNNFDNYELWSDSKKMAKLLKKHYYMREAGIKKEKQAQKLFAKREKLKKVNTVLDKLNKKSSQCKIKKMSYSELASLERALS